MLKNYLNNITVNNINMFDFLNILTSYIERACYVVNFTKNFLYLQAKPYLLFNEYCLNVERTRYGKLLKFKLDNQDYCMLLPRGKLRLPPDRITNETGQDVTDIVRPYLGPNNDFFQSCQKITPKLLGFNSLTIHRGENDNVSFDNNQELSYSEN